jgi:hypothetical protein
MRCFDLEEGRLDSLRIGDVAPHSERARGRLAGTVGDGHLVTRGDEGLGDGAADAAVASGDEYRSAHKR